jgi:hypothetical protein
LDRRGRKRVVPSLMFVVVCDVERPEDEMC